MVACLVVVVLLASADAGAQVNWPLRISAHGAYLEDQSGVPFPVVGDGAWSAIVQLSQADLATYLNDRKAKGFTTLIMNAIEHYFSTNPPYDVYGNAPFTNGEMDWSVRNEAYWANVDYVLNQAKSMGFLVLFYPAYLGYMCGDQGWCQDMEAQPEATMTGYGQFLGNRYKSQGNIIYVHAADMVAEDYTGVYARVVDIANGIKSIDTTTLHTAESAPEHSAMDDYSAFINLNTTYTYADPAGKVQNDYSRQGALPFCFIESTYEGEGASLSDIQSQALIAYLGGALLGHVFGNNPVYGFGYDGPWIPSLQSPGAVSMSNIGSLVKSRAWYLLTPDYANVVVTSNKGPGVRNYKATARTADGATVMIWNPDSTPVTVNMTKISGASANVWSWNPVTTTATLTGTYPTKGSMTFTPSAGTVLVLDNAGLGFNPPGVIGTGTFTVTASVSGGNGSVSPQTQTVNYGQAASIVITPDSGYSITGITDNGMAASIANPYVITNVVAAHTVVVAFAAAPSAYTLTVTKTGSGSGTVTTNPSGTSFTPGTPVTLTAAPAANSTFAGWSGGCSSTRTTCSLTMNSNVKVGAAFNLQTYIISASAGQGGYIAPSGSVIVTSGASRAFTITPDSRYKISYLLVDAGRVSAAGSYTFTNVTANHSIMAVFTRR
jgi:hypothetical protein